MHQILIYGMILFDSINNENHIGGPPLNVALHMARMGQKPWLISAVGEDALGEQAREILKNENVSDHYVKTDSHQTGQSVAYIDDAGIPSFILQSNVAYEYITLPEEKIIALAKNEYDLLYFGTIEQESEVSRRTLKRLLNDLSFKHTFYDINLREGHYSKNVIDFLFGHTDILKLNDEEIFLINKIFDLGLYNEQDIIDWLFKMYQFNIIIVTRGKNGASAYSSSSCRQNVEGLKVKVKDTVGAGDAFSAGFIAEYLESKNILEALKQGNRLGAFVASQTGSVPAIKDGF